MNAFNWRQNPSETTWKQSESVQREVKKDYPQSAYYWRKKAGLTQSRQNPDRHWRKREQ